MSLNKQVCIEAINLRTKRISGFKLLTVYSREYGLIKLSGSKMGGRSEPFVNNRYWITTGKSDIHSIKQTEFIGHFKKLGEDLDKLYVAWQFAEFLEACSHPHEERSEQVFNLFFECLSQLEKEEIDKTQLVNYFLWKLTEFLGYKPLLSVCERDNCSLKNGKTVESWFNFEQGGISCSDCSEKPRHDFVNILPGIYKSLVKVDSMDQFCLQENVNERAQNFIKNLIQKYLQKHTDRRIKSISIN